MNNWISKLPLKISKISIHKGSPKVLYDAWCFCLSHWEFLAEMVNWPRPPPKSVVVGIVSTATATAIFLILAWCTVLVVIARPALVQAELSLPFCPAMVAFQPSQLRVWALVLAAIKTGIFPIKLLLVRSIGTLNHSIADVSSVNTEVVFLRAGEQGRVAMLVAPILRVAGKCGMWFETVAIFIGLTSPPLRCFFIPPNAPIAGNFWIEESKKEVDPCDRLLATDLSRHWANAEKEQEHCDLFQESGAGSDVRAKAIRPYKDGEELHNTFQTCQSFNEKVHLKLQPTLRELKSLPEAKRTQDIEFGTWIIFMGGPGLVRWTCKVVERSGVKLAS